MEAEIPVASLMDAYKTIAVSNLATETHSKAYSRMVFQTVKEK